MVENIVWHFTQDSGLDSLSLFILRNVLDDT